MKHLFRFRRALVPALSLVTILGGIGIQIATERISRVYAGSNRVAFTATTLSKVYDGSGVETRTMSKTVAVRADGSTSLLKRAFYKKGDRVISTETREIHDVRTREQVEIHPAVASKITFRMEQGTAERLAAKPGSSCNDHGGKIETKPEVSSILGFPVIRRIMTTSKSEGQSITVEEWLAPGLDCLPLRVSATLQDPNGSVIGRDVEDVSSVRLGEPDGSLFEVPSQLTERSPSQVMAAEKAARGEACEGCQSAGVTAADRNYLNRRK